MGLPAYDSSGAATTANSVAHPATVNAGDLLMLTRVFKYPASATPDTPAGWTLQGNVTGGAGSPGAGTGDVGVYVWTKEADGTEDGTNLTISATGTVNASLSQIHRFTKTSALRWSIAVVTGTDTESSTTYDVTAGTALALVVDDLLVVLAGVNANVNPGSVALVASGATFTGTTERSDNGTVAGDDLRHDLITGGVTSGSSSGAPQVTATLTAAGAGAAVFVRLREIPVQGDAAITDSADTVSAAGTVTGTPAAAPSSGGSFSYPYLGAGFGRPARL